MLEPISDCELIEVWIDVLCPQATILIMSEVLKPAVAKRAVMVSRSCVGSGTPSGPTKYERVIRASSISRLEKRATDLPL